MKKTLSAILAFVIATFLLSSQNNYLTIQDGIRLPEDNVEKNRLLSDLNGFLTVIRDSKESSRYIFPDERAETDILLEDIMGITKSEKHKNDLFFKPYLTNVVPLPDEGDYLIQLSYIGIDNNIPVLRGSFVLVARKINNGFLFSSPLKMNTREWQSRKAGNYTFYYQKSINENIIKEYVKVASDFDKKLEINKLTEIYCCENVFEVMAFVGVQYKSDYNGILNGSLTNFSDEDKAIIIDGVDNARFDNFDPHDLFHERVSIAIPEGKNHFMVCGAAYVYGGSWGISWTEIQKMFKSRMVYDKNTDWLKLYFDRYNFGESNREHLLVAQFINALIIQKTEKDKGFSAVRKLLSSGNMMKDRKNFFTILNDVTGINEGNFNENVSNLINEAMEKIARS